MGVRERERERERELGQVGSGGEKQGFLETGAGREPQIAATHCSLVTSMAGAAAKGRVPLCWTAHGLLSTPHLSKKCLLPPESLGCP